jgi:ATP-binding cassette subfamily F protein uup
MITGRLQPQSGKVTVGQTVDLCHVDQERESLDPAKTVWQEISEGQDLIKLGKFEVNSRSYVAKFNFTGQDQQQLVGSLSGGQRNRVQLAKMLRRGGNCILLDEPTNDLDLETLDLLQEVIADYDGTVLIVSHDRDFLDRTVTMTIGLDGSGTVDMVVGGYADWEAKRRIRTEAKKVATKAETAAAPKARTKLSYKDQRDYDLLPKRIEELDAAIARDETALADPDLYAKHPDRFEKLMATIARARDEKDAAELRWLELAEMAEGLG